MKRRLSFFLAAVLVISQLMCIDCAEASTEDLTKEITVFNRLNILNIDIDNGFEEDETVSRAKFADMTAKALNAAPSAEVRYFSDVPHNYPEAGSINALYEMGIISPAEDRHFNPDIPITYAQACKIMVFAAGYKDYVMFENSGLSGYVNVAENMGIGVKIKDRNAMTAAEAIKLLYNGMSAGIVTPSGINQGKVDTEKTLFSVYQRVHTGKGIITAVYGAEMRGYRKVNEGEIRIGEDEFKLFEGYYPDTLFGKHTEYVYIENDDDTNTLLYAGSLKSHAEDLYITSDMISGFDAESYSLKYYKNEKKSSVYEKKLKKGMQIIYNGKPFDGSLAEAIGKFPDEERRGSLRLIDNSGDAGYDVMIIKSYERFIVGNYNTHDNVLYSYYDTARRLNLDDYELLRVCNQYGGETQLPAETPAALSIAESENGEYAEIVVCLNKKEGKLERTDLSEGVIWLNGEQIDIDKALAEDFRGIGTGSSISVTLDNFGYAVFVNMGGSEMRTVYAIKVKCRLEDDYRFALTVYEQDKKFHVYDFADKVKVDGSKYNTNQYKKFFDAFPGDIEVTDTGETVRVNFKRQIIRIKLNKTGEISEIDTSNKGKDENEENTLVKYHDGSEELIYSSHLKRFGMDTLYSSGQTQLFVVPSANSEGEIVINGEKREETADMYNTKYSFTHDYYYAIESYNYNKNNKYTDVIVLSQDPTTDFETVFMFDKYIETVNSDDEAVKQIIGYANGNKMKIFVDETAEAKLGDLSRGDIVRVITNSSETAVCDIIKMFDCGTMTFNNDNVNPNWYSGLGKGDSSAWQWNYRNAKYQLTKGYALEVKDGILKTTYNSVDLPYGIFDEAIDAGSTQYVIYDGNEGETTKIRGGSINDILDYKSAGKDCSLVLINLKYGALNQVFVYTMHSGN